MGNRWYGAFVSHAALLACYSPPLIVVDSADFDGSNDFLARGADLSGNADSKSGILSVWVRFDSGTGAQRIIGSNGDNDQGFESQRRSSSGAFEIIGRNAAGTDILLLRTSASFVAGATWRHFLASWDLATGAGHLYVNDVSDLGSSTLTNDTIDYAEDNYGVGGNPVSGAVKLDGALAELYFAPGQYLDLSILANRRKFISNTGKPVWLGANGSAPTGTAAIVYLHLDNSEAVANFATNRGTGGNFSITGTLETGSTSPSD